jgi:hypothetical protein
MPKPIPEPDLYEAFSGLLAGLKVLEAALAKERAGCAPKPKLTPVAGQGRGSKKPRAKLSSVGGDDA